MTGATGQLGGQILDSLIRDGGEKVVWGVSRSRIESDGGVHSRIVDLANPDGLVDVLREAQPTHVLHVGAMTSIAECHANPDLATAVNTVATRCLASAAADCGARFVFSSTDMVFAGDGAPYCEPDPPRPSSQYGRTKAAAERTLFQIPGTLVVRLPLMYGFPVRPRDTTFVRQVAALRAYEKLNLFIDEFRTPIALADAARALIALARGTDTGVLHVAGPERLSRLQLVERFAVALGISAVQANPVSRLSAAGAEPRPADLSLDGRRFVELYPACAPRSVITALLAR